MTLRADHGDVLLRATLLLWPAMMLGELLHGEGPAAQSARARFIAAHSRTLMRNVSGHSCILSVRRPSVVGRRANRPRPSMTLFVPIFARPATSTHGLGCCSPSGIGVLRWNA